MTDRTTTDPGTLIDRESGQRARAGWSAMAGSVLLLATTVVTQIINAGAPAILLTDALRDAAGESFGDPPRQGLLNEWIQYLHDKFGLDLLGAGLQILFLAAVAILLSFLFDAAKGRRSETPAWLRSMTLAGAGALAITAVLAVVSRHISFGEFLDGSDLSSDAARDARTPGGVQIASMLSLFGALALGAGWLLISLNAMRAGLLTRFLGTLGIFSGAATLLSVLAPGLGGTLTIIQVFWLLFTGLLVLGRSPGGTPPAWISGKAEPWPSAEEVRKQREAARAATDDDVDAPATPGAAEPPAVDAPSPATSARKRKRRG